MNRQKIVKIMLIRAIIIFESVTALASNDVSINEQIA